MKTNFGSLNKFFHVASYVSFVIYVFAASMICGILFYLTILPLRYLAIIIGVSILFAALFGFLVFRKKTKPTIRNIVLAVETIFAAAYIALFIFLNTNLNLVAALQAGGYKIEEYSVITLKNSPYQDLKSLEGAILATYDDRSDSYKKALSELEENVVLTIDNYQDAVKAAEALLNNRASAILLKNAMRELVAEILPDFNNDNIKSIHSFKIRTIAEKTASNNLDITEKPFNILISGIDTRGEISTVSRSDVNMIITINPKTYQILLTSIPRDYYVQLHDTIGLRDKLTHSGLYGIDMTRKTLEDLFGINIDYYIRLNFDSTEKIINAIDGIDLTPDTTFTTGGSGHNYICHFYANETIHVNGACGLSYARTRKAYKNGDFHRILNQQEVLVAIIDKLSSNKSPTAYTDFLSAAEGSIETDIPTSQIYRLINLQLDKFPHWTINRISVSGTSSKDYTYSITTELLYVVEPDMGSVHAATDQINAILNNL